MHPISPSSAACGFVCFVLEYHDHHRRLVDFDRALRCVALWLIRGGGRFPIPIPVRVWLFLTTPDANLSLYYTQLGSPAGCRTGSCQLCHTECISGDTISTQIA